MASDFCSAKSGEGEHETVPVYFTAPRHRHLTQKEDPMDADQPKGKWVQFTGALKTRWSRFRDQHLVQCEESDAQFVDTAHDRYGDNKDEFMHEGGRPAASAIAARSRWGNAPPNRYHSCVTSDDRVSHFSFMNESHHDASRQASPLHSEPLADRSPRCFLLILLNPKPSLRLVRRGCDGSVGPLSDQRDKEAHREYRATSQEEGSRRSEEARSGSSRV